MRFINIITYFFIRILISNALRHGLRLPEKLFCTKTVASVVSGAFLSILPVISPILSTNAREVGNIATSGFIFKDSMKINAFVDPKIQGITLYISDFERPITEKLSKDFFNDPSSSSITCVKSGPINLKDSGISLDSSGEEVFEESRNLFFKQIRVNRIYDPQAKTLIYVSFNTRFDKGNDSNKSRFKSSLCAVHID
eukprot:gene8166-11052_t